MSTSGKPIDNTYLLRLFPSVYELVEGLRAAAGEGPSGAALADAAREAIEDRRRRILAGGDAHNGAESADEAAGAGDTEAIRTALRGEIIDEACCLLDSARTADLRHVINATGIVLHTNLGRAPLSEAARQAIIDVSRSYSNLEYDLEAGRRGGRSGAVETLLRKLTGAEAAVVVNNNAAAVMFAIRMMAEGREVVVSRGELVEIGGSFRIPDIMAQSGARMVEVGATNKTHVSDFERAIGPDTALLLKAHTSNFRIVGFTEEVPREALAALAHARGIPVLEDLGSGCFVNPPGIPDEPTVAASVEAGVDVITFSGDKLLGGPQAGIIVGKSEWVDRLKKHPMMRALRLNKLTLAALEATLRAYLDPERAMREVPALRMLAEAADAAGARADALLTALGIEAAGRLRAEVVETAGRVGGGAMPLANLESRALALSPQGISADRLGGLLRAASPPVVARIHEDRLLLDMRCVIDEEIEPLAAILRALAEGAG
ncbi:MAG: L-seryl-tRNA(Sec) selenium transferase [Nitrospinota bacterium]|nr:L-seryl-tRNA(Sec) selenium transferase [Nitrospinota bacterium]